jgi:hypothetical protein
MLLQILETAVDAGANCVEFEYVDEGLQICIMVGHFGMGSVLTDPLLAGSLMKLIVESARLESKSRGKMTVEIRGKQRNISVQEYEDFGEIAFRLTLDKPER